MDYQVAPIKFRVGGRWRSAHLPPQVGRTQTSAMVTSTSTPGSIEICVICFTISEGECKSMRRLWMHISQRSYVFVPSPHGDFLPIKRSVRVGRRTGPFTCNSFSRAPEIRSAHTFSSDFT